MMTMMIKPWWSKQVLSLGASGVVFPPVSEQEFLLHTRPRSPSHCHHCHPLSLHSQFQHNHCHQSTQSDKLTSAIFSRAHPLTSPINNHSSRVPSHGPVPMVAHHIISWKHHRHHCLWWFRSQSSWSPWSRVGEEEGSLVRQIAKERKRRIAEKGETMWPQMWYKYERKRLKRSLGKGGKGRLSCDQADAIKRDLQVVAFNHSVFVIEEKFLQNLHRKHGAHDT